MTDARPDTRSRAHGYAGWLALSLLLAAVLLASTRDIRNSDLGFHLAAGRLMVEQGGFIHADDFSYVAQDRPWRNFEWLYQLVTYGCWRLAGPAGVILEHALFNLLLFAILATAFFRKRGLYATGVLLLLLVLLACELRFTIRPHALGRCLTALFLAEVLRYRRTGRHAFWLLVPLQAVWANLHGSYTLALPVVGLLLFDELFERRPAGKTVLLLLALALASLATPSGWHQTVSLWQHQRAIAAAHTNPEWMPLEVTLPALSDPAFWAFTLLALSAGALLWRAGRTRVGWFEWALWLLALFAPFLHVRTLPASAITFALLCAHAGPVKWPRSTNGAWVVVAAVLVLMVAGLATGRYAEAWKRPARLGLGIDPRARGWEAGKFLAGMEPAGRVFNSYSTGGWLIWWLYPQGTRVFIDGRDVGNVYTLADKEEYLRLLADYPYFDAARSRYQWNAVVLERDHELGQDLIGNLQRSRAWQAAFTNETTVVFLPALRFQPRP